MASGYAGTQSGVYYSIDGGESWSQYSAALPVSSILSLALVSGSSGALLAGTNGASAFSTAPLAGISEQPGTKPYAHPAQLSIAPNPFRTKTAISLQLTARHRCRSSTRPAASYVPSRFRNRQSEIDNRKSP
jgi:hypothetical protein